MIIQPPYFMENPDWYYWDEEEFRYKLTDAATEKARASYAEYYEIIEED